MKRIFLLAVVLLLLLCGCGEEGRDCLEYRNGAFESEVGGEVDGVRFRAHVVCGEPREESDADGSVRTLRDSRVEFYSPESMKGICVLSDGEGVQVTLGDIEIKNAKLEGFLFIADALCPEGSVAEVALESFSGKEANKLSLNGSGEHSIYIDALTDLPIGAKLQRDGRSVLLEIVWLERLGG